MPAMPTPIDAPPIERALATGSRASARPPAGRRSAESAARELDAEITLLLRVRRGELAEPLSWRQPVRRRQVEAIVRQLAPIRSRAALLSSLGREASPSPEVRLAYGIALLSIDREIAADETRRRRRRAAMRLLRGGG
jgi:hypothetical protein